MAGVLEITDENFKEEVTESDDTVLLDFYAAWCGPCKTIEPIVSQLAEEYADRGLKVGKVDIDAAQKLAVAQGVQSVPTLMIFKGGKPVDRMVGALPKPTIEEKIKQYL